VTSASPSESGPPHLSVPDIGLSAREALRAASRQRLIVTSASPSEKRGGQRGWFLLVTSVSPSEKRCESAGYGRALVAGYVTSAAPSEKRCEERDGCAGDLLLGVTSAAPSEKHSEIKTVNRRHSSYGL